MICYGYDYVFRLILCYAYRSFMMTVENGSSFVWVYPLCIIYSTQLLTR